MRKSVIIFGCGVSSSSHKTNRENNIYVLGKDFVQGVNGTTLYAEKIHKTDFMEQNKKFALSLHCNGDNSYLFPNGVEQLKFKTKNIEIARKLLCFGNISTAFSTTNMQKTGLYGNVYDFAIDYVPVSVGKIYDVQRYLTKKKMILYKMFGFIKKVLILVLISTVNSLKCISITNQECKVREVIINNEYMTYPYSIKVNKCNGNCNNINNPYSRVCVPNITKNVTLKIFDLMTLTNKTKQTIFHESCKYICRLEPIACKNKQK